MEELQRRRIRLEMLDIGGGLPARYGEALPPLAAFAAAIEDGLERLPYRPPLVCAEPGRHLVAESGVLVASVIGVHDRGGQRWAHLDVGGYNGLMEAVQTAGRWQFPLRTSRRDHFTVPHQPFTVTGPSCDSSDTMFYDAMLPATLREGDRVYVGCAGAYTLSYASHFNGFPPPSVHYAAAHAAAPVP
jgi:ornithine decarboxylase